MKTVRYNYQKVCMVALLGAVLFSSSVNATDTINIPITITATIIIPPCKLNNSNAITVDFSEVQTRHVNRNTNEAQRTITTNVPVICPAAVTSVNDLKVTVRGAAAAAAYILSTQGGTHAGIALYQGDNTTKPLTLNQSLPFAGLGKVTGNTTTGYTGNLSFTAVVVQATPGTEVSEGIFSASATLLLKQA